jgi:hypothetical protein
MTPKEKANELYLKMLDWVYNGNKYLEHNIVSTSAKQCALIAVDEIINTNALSEQFDYGIDKTNIFYWEQVKNEIEKL